MIRHKPGTPEYQRDRICRALKLRLERITGQNWHVTIFEDGIRTTAGPHFLCKSSGFAEGIRVPLDARDIAFKEAIKDRANLIANRWEEWECERKKKAEQYLGRWPDSDDADAATNQEWISVYDMRPADGTVVYLTLDVETGVY